LTSKCVTTASQFKMLLHCRQLLKHSQNLFLTFKRTNMINLNNLVVDESRLLEDALKVVLQVRESWTADSVNKKVFTDGISNKLVGFWAADDHGKADMLLVRVYGQKTEAIIDREAEKRNMVLMSDLGCAKPLYATFANGLCYGFIHGQCLDAEMVRLPDVNRLIAAEMVRIHAVTPKGSSTAAETEATIWRQLHNFLDLLPERMSDPVKEDRRRNHLPSSDELKAIVAEMEEKIKAKTTSPLVFCHNDLLVANIVWNRDDDRTYFIDFEYGGFNYLAYDIANHFNEHTGVDAVLDHSLYPDKEYQLQWLTNYIRFSKAHQKSLSLTDVKAVNQVPVSPEELEELYADVQRQAVLSDLMWSLWAIRQAEVSTIDFDFMAYAISKYEGFRIKREKAFGA